MVQVLGGVIFIGILIYAVFFAIDLYRHRDEIHLKKHPIALTIISFLCMFGDTIGIGSFGPFTTSWKVTKSIESDTLIPGTLNAGTGIATAMEGVLFLIFGKSNIDPLTCISMIIAAGIGAVIGSKIVCRLSLKALRYGMGTAMLIVAIILACRNAGFGPFGVVGTELGVRGIKLAVAIIVNFILGALMMIGIGQYAPCMALISLLGMDVRLAFPIMTGSCGVLMLTGGINFIREGKYDRTASVYATVVGLIGVFCAYLFVENLPIQKLMWVVICAIVVTAVLFLRDAVKMRGNNA